MVQISKKMIEISRRKGHLSNEHIFIRIEADRPFVHSVFDNVPLLVPVLPNGLSDQAKNQLSNVGQRGGYLVKILAKSHLNFGFQRNLKFACFFLGHPVYIFNNTTLYNFQIVLNGGITGWLPSETGPQIRPPVMLFTLFTTFR